MNTTPLTFGSLFAGIGGLDLGLERAGMRPVWQVEINKQRRRILAHHWPDVDRSVTDVTKAGRRTLAPVHLICGGFPCQDLSVAGTRKGLSGEHSGLWFQFHRVLAELAPQWVVIENVPGLLSSNKGRDFATILQGLVQLGYRVCWRILDAQYFGLAQQRRRVFIVAHLGTGRAAKVLFESNSSAWNPPPSRTARQNPTQHTRDCTESGSTQRQYPVEFHPGLSCWQKRGGLGIRQYDDIAPTLQTHRKTRVFVTIPTNGTLRIRRLTPRERERLQGFPDDHTLVENIKDSPRYSALGDAVAVPCAEWIGRRILKITKEG